MNKEDKNTMIDTLAEKLKNANVFYLADTSDLNAETTTKLRRLCFKSNVKLEVVKNTLLRKAMERTGKDYSELYETLNGPTSIMFAEVGNVPARLIKDFRKDYKKPILKAAYIDEAIFVGENQLDSLVALKSKNELIADIIALLQSPTKNVVSALQSGGGKLAGILKTLSEKENN